MFVYFNEKLRNNYCQTMQWFFWSRNALRYIYRNASIVVFCLTSNHFVQLICQPASMVSVYLLVLSLPSNLTSSTTRSRAHFQNCYLPYPPLICALLFLSAYLVMWGNISPGRVVKLKFHKNKSRKQLIKYISLPVNENGNFVQPET